MAQDQPAPEAAESHALRKSAEARAWEVLQQGVTEKSMRNRLMAVTTLGDIVPNAQALKLGDEGLKDKEPEVRQAAAAALGHMKARGAIPELRAALDDPAPEVGLAAAEALWRIGDRRVRGVLLEVLAGERPTSEGLLKREMRDAHRKLHDPKGLVWMGASQGAGALLGPMSFVIPLAKGIASEKGVSPRAATATLLSSDRNPRSITALEEALTDKDWSVRAASAKALGEICRRQFVPSLEPLLLDDKPAVRYAAAAAIIRISCKRGHAPGSRQASQGLSAANDSAVHAGH